MRSRRSAWWVVVLAVFVGVIPGVGEEYRQAEAGYEFSFPRDHFEHREFRTEWWYYTGNLWTAEGRRFGFELTFFRQGTGRTGDESVWNLEDIYFAHLALSDIEGQEFLHDHRLNRAGPGLAGASLERQSVWNGNWQVTWDKDEQRLRAVSERFSIELDLVAAKQPVVHGANGMSRKGAGQGEGSHHVSLTRLAASGAILFDEERHVVSGQAWMDHEFFSHQLGEGLAGWDWFSIQLEDASELMVYRLRKKDGSTDSYSGGTWVAPDGKAVTLGAGDFAIEPGRRWKNYPVEWKIRVPWLGIELLATTPLDEQELTGIGGVAPTYWEGAMDFEGTRNGRAIRGTGYLEMTGYADRVRFTQADDR
jgi:predicted secreted hydrolase